MMTSQGVGTERTIFGKVEPPRGRLDPSLQFPPIPTSVNANPLCDKNYPNIFPSSVFTNSPFIGFKFYNTSAMWQ